MERPETFELDAEVIERQRLLNGAEHVWLEGEVQRENGSWLLSLNYVRPKEIDSLIDEADLTLDGPDGTLEAAVETGSATVEIDDLAGDERIRLALDMRIEDGQIGALGGLVRVHVEILGDSARIELTIHPP